MAALAKRLDEVFLPGASESQNIPRTSSGLKLLQQLRDEAHRFAITFHRTLRRKRTLQSELDKIPGVGEKRRNVLVKYFGSVEVVKEATVSEIASVQGINNAIARIVWEYFHVVKNKQV